MAKRRPTTMRNPTRIDAILCAHTNRNLPLIAPTLHFSLPTLATSLRFFLIARSLARKLSSQNTHRCLFIFQKAEHQK